jgi:hypothetical protein
LEISPVDEEPLPPERAPEGRRELLRNSLICLYAALAKWAV